MTDVQAANPTTAPSPVLTDGTPIHTETATGQIMAENYMAQAGIIKDSDSKVIGQFSAGNPQPLSPEEVAQAAMNMPLGMDFRSPQPLSKAGLFASGALGNPSAMSTSLPVSRTGIMVPRNNTQQSEAVKIEPITYESGADGQRTIVLIINKQGPSALSREQIEAVVAFLRENLTESENGELAAALALRQLVLPVDYHFVLFSPAGNMPPALQNPPLGPYMFTGVNALNGLQTVADDTVFYRLSFDYNTQVTIRRSTFEHVGALVKIKTI